MRFNLTIPDPCLVVLVGAAGSGKSTFAARHFAAGEILASDDFRARLGRGEADQAATRRAFQALHAVLERRLAAGRTSVVDATNVRAEARRALVRRATAAGVPALAIVLDLSLAECLAGDGARTDRHVPAAVVERQWIALRATLEGATFAPEGLVAEGLVAEGLVAEGFVAAHRLTSRAAVDSVVLRRGGEGWPTLSRAPAPGRRR